MGLEKYEVISDDLKQYFKSIFMNNNFHNQAYRIKLRDGNWYKGIPISPLMMSSLSDTEFSFDFTTKDYKIYRIPFSDLIDARAIGKII